MCCVLLLAGGITGVTTAYMLKQKGKKVGLIDMGGICQLVTGNTTAKVTAQHGPIYNKLISMHGVKAANQYGQANLDGAAATTPAAGASSSCYSSGGRRLIGGGGWLLAMRVIASSALRPRPSACCPSSVAVG